MESDDYLQADEAGEGEEGEGERKENHLAGDQHHHPPHQELLPAELVVQPLGDQLDVPARQLPHLWLHLPRKLLLHHRHLHPSHQLRRGPQPGGPLLWPGGHDFDLSHSQISLKKCWNHPLTAHSMLPTSLGATTDWRAVEEEEAGARRCTALTLLLAPGLALVLLVLS